MERELFRDFDEQHRQRLLRFDEAAVAPNPSCELMTDVETPMLDPAGQFGRKICFDLLLVARKIGL